MLNLIQHKLLLVRVAKVTLLSQRHYLRQNIQNYKYVERIKSFKRLMIDNECFIRFKKLILDGPKYLVPLIDGTFMKFFLF